MDEGRKYFTLRFADAGPFDIVGALPIRKMSGDSELFHSIVPLRLASFPAVHQVFTGEAAKGSVLPKVFPVSGTNKRKSESGISHLFSVPPVHAPNRFFMMSNPIFSLILHPIYLPYNFYGCPTISMAKAAMPPDAAARMRCLSSDSLPIL